MTDSKESSKKKETGPDPSYQEQQEEQSKAGVGGTPSEPEKEVKE